MFYLTFPFHPSDGFLVRAMLLDDSLFSLPNLTREDGLRPDDSHISDPGSSVNIRLSWQQDGKRAQPRGWEDGPGWLSFSTPARPKSAPGYRQARQYTSGRDPEGILGKEKKCYN